MAKDRAELFKGIDFLVEGRDLLPNKEYYATLRDDDSGDFICSQKMLADEYGVAMFTFPYERTNELKDGAVLSVFVFEAERNFMALHCRRVVAVIPTSLTDDKDVPSYQLPNIN